MTGDPLADFPNSVWYRLSDFTGHTIGQVRATLKIYLSALDAVGYDLVPRDSPKGAGGAAEVAWADVTAAVATVLGDVASDRDMGLMVAFDSEVARVVDAVRGVVER